MSECVSIDTRERLPEYLHDRLVPAERSSMVSHLAECEECRLELALLASVRDALAGRAPAIDTASIVRALPRARVRRAAQPWVLQLAAALTFVSLGGVSLVVARSFFGPGSPAAIVDSAAGPTHDTLASGVEPAVASGRHVLTIGGGVADLGADQLEQLLGALEAVEALPSADPDEVVGTVLPRESEAR
jgi:anti-sigma factor RsiW